MFVKISSRGGAGLAKYWMESPGNDAVELVGSFGTIQEDVYGSVSEMDMLGRLSNGTKTISHIIISPPDRESLSMTNDDYLHVLTRVMEAANLKDQPFTAVKHFKDNSWHMHVGVQRYDTETGTLRSDSYNSKAILAILPEVRKELGHKPPPEHAFKKADFNKINFKAWQESTDAKSYQDQLVKHKLVLAQNHTRDPFVVVDETGRSFSVSRNLKNRETETYIKKSEVFKKLSGHKLPLDKEVIADIRTKQRQAAVLDGFKENSVRDRILERMNKNKDKDRDQD